MQNIIYKNGDNSVCILAPVEGCGLTIEQIARKDVPAGTSYDIVDVTDLDVVCGYDGKLYVAGEEPTKPSPTLEDQLAAIEAKYEQKQAELDKALVAALRMNGAQEAAARAAIKQKSLKLIQDQNDEIYALSAQQNGG